MAKQPTTMHFAFDSSYEKGKELFSVYKDNKNIYIATHTGETAIQAIEKDSEREYLGAIHTHELKILAKDVTHPQAVAAKMEFSQKNQLNA